MKKEPRSNVRNVSNIRNQDGAIFSDLKLGFGVESEPRANPLNPST